ncbi:MAG: DUF488 domain-containing protein [Burkholderiales bacterium]
MVKLKRAYDPVSTTDGIRLLVERLWPRGLSKETLKRTAGSERSDRRPSSENGLATIPRNGRSFAPGTFRELDSQPESWKPIASLARRRSVTLVYSSHDEDHNNAVALRECLQLKSLVLSFLV